MEDTTPTSRGLSQGTLLGPLLYDLNYMIRKMLKHSYYTFVIIAIDTKVSKKLKYIITMFLKMLLIIIVLLNRGYIFFYL